MLGPEIIPFILVLLLLLRTKDGAKSNQRNLSRHGQTVTSPQPRSVCRQMGGRGGQSRGRPPTEVATSDSEKAAKARKNTNNNRSYGVELGRVDATHQSHQREFHQTLSPKFRSRLRECGDEASSRGNVKRMKEEEGGGGKKEPGLLPFLPCKKTLIS